MSETTKPRIEVWTRDVEGTGVIAGLTTMPFIPGYGYPQHMYIIKVNADGTREILRGGPENGNMIMDDIKVVHQDYEDPKQDDGSDTFDYYDPTQPNILHHQKLTTYEYNTQAELDAAFDNGEAFENTINAEKYDYEIPSQNSNTVVIKALKAMGLDSNLVIQKLHDLHLTAPAANNEFTHSLIDRLFDAGETTGHWTLEKLDKFITKLSNNNDIDINYIKDYLSNLPVGEAISAILSAQLDFLNAQGLSTRWALHDPLVLDLDGDGIELMNIEDSNAYFDIDGDGIAERTGWVKGEDGILVRDITGNGKIENFMIKIAC